MNKSFFIFLVLVLVVFAAPSTAKAEFRVGWWAQMPNSSQFPTWASYGANFLHADWFFIGYYKGAYSVAQITAWLNAAQANGMKVSMASTGAQGGTSGHSTAYNMSATNYAGWINLWKNHPAMWGWYIADEPEIYNSINHSYLLNNPGYYTITKSVDPVHYAWLVFSGAIATLYDDVTDFYSVDIYPRSGGDCSSAGDWTSSQVRTSYDLWGNAYNAAVAKNKLPFIMVAKGMGVGYQNNCNLTLDEHRYHVFSGVVRGIDHILFWMYPLSNATVIGRVHQIMSEINQIKNQMTAGATNSGLSVNQPTSNLTYRYGTAGNSGVILGVNIANRGSVSGQTLSNVQFTLPSGVRPTQVTVVGENRTLPVTNGVFTDTFNRFAVHIYSFTSSATSTPIPTSTPTPSFSPSPSSGPSACDQNHDAFINVLDLQSLANVILGKTTCVYTCDLNQDSSVNVLDLQYLANVILGKNTCQ